MAPVFAKAVDYQEILRDVTVNLIRLKQPKRLLRLIARFIDQKITLSHISILILEEDRKHFTFVHSKGAKRFPAGLLKIDINHPFIQWFHGAVKTTSSKNYYLCRPSIEKSLKEGEKKSDKNGHQTPQEKICAAMNFFGAELIVPAYDGKKLIAVLMFGKRKSGEVFSSADINFFQSLAHICAIALKTAQYHEDLLDRNEKLEHKVREIEAWQEKERKTYYQILRSLAQEVQAKDPYTFGHVKQVEKLGLMTAREIGIDLSGRRKDILSAALILHDIGKIGIPDHILQKPAKLTTEEWVIMRSHVEKGVRILEHLELFREVADIIHCHHERYDGTGYPRGLKVNLIPIEARIITVVDAYHAIVSKRCYDPARPVEEAFRELTLASGTQFDPDVVKAFIRAQRRELAKWPIPSEELETVSE